VLLALVLGFLATLAFERSSVRAHEAPSALAPAVA
jgi:hypothetical protein